MKTLTLSLTTLALLGSLTAATAQINVDTQIEAIQTASPQERVELMNQFKEQLSQMNADERTEAITQMRTQMQTRAQEHAGEGQGQMQEGQAHAQEIREQMQDRAQMGQDDNMNQIQGMEQMNQRHGGDQFMHEGPMGGDAGAGFMGGHDGAPHDGMTQPDVAIPSI